MSKKRIQAARSYNFKVYIEGKQVSVSKISNMKGHWEVEPFQEGGRNNTEYKNKTLGKNNGQLTLSRMVTFSGFTKYLPGQKLDKEVEVHFINDKGTPEKSYYFIGCTIMEVNYSELDAGQSNVTMQDIVIEYQRMENIK